MGSRLGRGLGVRLGLHVDRLQGAGDGSDRITHLVQDTRGQVADGRHLLLVKILLAGLVQFVLGVLAGADVVEHDDKDVTTLKGQAADP